MILSRLFYLALLVAAFIFSQALYDSISLFTLAVVVLIPIVSFLFLVISLFLVKVEIGQAPAHQRRLQRFFLPITVTSRSPLMLPMVKLNLRVSNPTADEAVRGYTFVHYKAFGSTTVQIPLKFDVRGVYKVGADSVVFYDFLRLFSIKRKINNTYNVIVEPRDLRTDIPVEVTSQEQESAVTVGGKETQFNGDMAGIREFNEYDTLKKVHWKLSARLARMIVKTYWENACDNVMVLADLFSYDEDRLTNRRLTDCVVEITTRLCGLLADEGVRCTLGYSNYEALVHQQSITSTDDLLMAMDHFRMAPMMEAGALEQMVGEVDFSALNGGALYVITSCDPERLERAMEPYVRGLNCRLQYIVIRPGSEGPRGNHMTVMTLAELEHDKNNR